MTLRVSADVASSGFALSAADDGLYLEFPTFTHGPLTGNAGAVTWSLASGAFEGVSARLRRGTWRAKTGSLRQLMLRSGSGASLLEIDSIELPDGLQISRGHDGTELLAPTARLRGVRIKTQGGVAAPSTPIAVEDQAPATGAGASLRQQQLRFLDGLHGTIGVTVKVQLDLPVLGVRSLDQRLDIAIKDGCLNFRDLDRSLDWLEGAFLDIGLSDERLGVYFRVPIVGTQREIISWTLDTDARTLAKLDRVPVRSLADFRIAGRPAGGGGASDKGRGRGVLRALLLDHISVTLSMNAPRSVAIGETGHVLFGGDDAAGLVDLKVTGAVGDGSYDGALRGSIGALDLTVADLALGSAGVVWMDRVRLGQVDPVEFRLKGFDAAGVSMEVAEVDVNGLRLTL
jgi:hypothetical protein